MFQKKQEKFIKSQCQGFGGLAVIAGFAISVIYLLIVMSVENTINLFGPEEYYLKLIGFFSGIVILGVFCFVDDLKGINPFVKLTGQILAAIVVAICGIQINRISLPFFDTFVTEEIAAIIVTVIWIVGITNAINLIDGLDRIIKWNFTYFVCFSCYNICIKWFSSYCHPISYCSCW